MNEFMAGVQAGTAKQPPAIETALRLLWEKIRTAAETIQILRRDKAELQARIAVLERETVQLRSEASAREQEVKRLRAERAQLLQADANVRFTDEEKEILKGRIRDLIAKINSHL